MAITVTALATTPIKGMRLRAVDAVELSELGARGNRAFYVIDEKRRLMNGKGAGAMQAVVPDYDVDAGELTLAFPSGEAVSGHVEYGEEIQTNFFGSIYFARELVGPWAGALSEFMAQPVRLVAPEIGTDRGRAGSVSLMSRASLRQLAHVASSDPIDGRRFRMLFEVEGVDAHAEDDWVRHQVRIGGRARIEWHGHVGRCATTTRDPDSGAVTFPTLHVLAAYRKQHRSEEPLPFGIYGEVLEGGTVRIGDELEVVR